MSAEAVSVRALSTYDEMCQIPRLQRVIWQFGDESGFYPPSLLSFAENGGLVLGAFDAATGDLVAFCVGFLARHWTGQLKLYSQSMGVLPAYRHAGLGYRLKCAQRDWALANGLTLITWTYDPLETPNARLNIAKLGATARRYKRNLYGESFGGLNAGLPSDRFAVEWFLDRPEVVARLAGTYAPRVEDAVPVTVTSGAGPDLKLARYNLDATVDALRVEVPADLQVVKARDLALAEDWRLGTRTLFEYYFARDYAATEFVSEITNGERRNFYVLRRGAAGTGDGQG